MEFLLIAIAHFVALLSPGPDFFLIMQASLRIPTRYCIALCVGIATANGLYLALAVFSLEAIRNFVWLTTGLKYLGAGYLVTIGLSLLRSTASPQNDRRKSASFLRTRSIRDQFLIGFMSAIFNPKNAIFYLSLFTVMVSESTGIEIRILYAVWMTSVVFFWDCGLAWIIGSSRIEQLPGKAVLYVEKFAGVALFAFGIYLPFT